MSLKKGQKFLRGFGKIFGWNEYFLVHFLTPESAYQLFHSSSYFLTVLFGSVFLIGICWLFFHRHPKDHCVLHVHHVPCIFFFWFAEHFLDTPSDPLWKKGEEGSVRWVLGGGAWTTHPPIVSIFCFVANSLTGNSLPHLSRQWTVGDRCPAIASNKAPTIVCCSRGRHSSGLTTKWVSTLLF